MAAEPDGIELTEDLESGGENDTPKTTDASLKHLYADMPFPFTPTPAIILILALGASIIVGVGTWTLWSNWKMMLYLGFLANIVCFVGQLVCATRYNTEWKGYEAARIKNAIQEMAEHKKRGEEIHTTYKTWEWTNTIIMCLIAEFFFVLGAIYWGTTDIDNQECYYDTKEQLRGRFQCYRELEQVNKALKQRCER